MSVDFAGVRLANPVWTASGTCGYADELADFMDVGALGGFITKSITLKPRKGNPTPRIVETDSGMLNAIGLANIGLERFIKEKVPIIKELGACVFVNEPVLCVFVHAIMSCDGHILDMNIATNYQTMHTI